MHFEGFAFADSRQVAAGHGVGGCPLDFTNVEEGGNGGFDGCLVDDGGGDHYVEAGAVSVAVVEVV